MSNKKKYVENNINNFIETINIIDNLFLKGRKIKDIVVYKGISSNLFKNVGDTFTFNNFLSTSIHNIVAETFANLKSDDDDNCCVCVLQNISKLNYIYLPWNIQKNIFNDKINDILLNEFEILLPRGLTFKLVKKEVKRTSFIKNNVSYNDLKSGIDYNKVFKKVTILYLKLIKQEQHGSYKKQELNFVFDAKKTKAIQLKK